MIRSTLSISAGLAVIAVVLTSLWIGYGPRPQGGGQDKRTAAIEPLSKQQRSGLDANGQPIRTITPGSPSNAGMVASAPTSATPPVARPTDQTANPRASVDPPTPERPADNASNPSLTTETTPEGAIDPSATTGGNVDLNTATVEQLNALGAGMIGKRIIEFRPYTSPDELLSRRVLKRADYDTIKSSVTVR